LTLIRTALLTITLAAPIFAGAQNVGAGGMTCAKYTTLKPVFDRPTLNAVTSWTHGYITATNVTRFSNHHAALRYADQQQVETYTKKFCTDHPLKNILDATQAMISELAGEG
jgi:hypothetical protein